MKPILYETTATSFTTNGIGILNDAMSCVVTQQRNGIYEAEIRYPMFGGIHFSEIKMRSIILVLPDRMSDPQPMRVYNISKPMRGIVTINCRHLAYDLMGIVASPFEATSVQQAFVNMKSAAVTPCPFTFWTDKSTAANMSVTEPTAIWSLLGGTEGSILDVYGSGEYEFNKYTIKLYQNRGYNRGVEIRYGKNLIDLDQEQNCESVYTGVYPYWTDQDGNLVQLSEKIVNASGTYDYTRIYPLDLSDQWDEAPSASDLRARAQKYITDNNIGVPKVSLEVSFVSLDQAEEYKDLALLEQVGLCDTVSVYFEKMDVTATAKVIEMRFDSILERYESIILGEAKTSLAGTMAAHGQAIKNSKAETETFVRASILSMTASILGAKGGAVRLLDTNDDGYPDTLYIADNSDPTLARKVWRFNYEGWGASSNGFNGPFTLGATLDSGIDADFITAGTLTANLIKAGVLSDSAGKNYWNMATGEFSLSSNTTVGGSTVSTIANKAASSAVNNQTQQSIFNKLTNNGQTQGIYLNNGKIYINGAYINTYSLTANNASLTGKLKVYNGSTLGGYVGFMNGSIGSKTTDGIGVSDGTGNNYLIATDTGVRLTHFVNTASESSVAAFSNNGIPIISIKAPTGGRMAVGTDSEITGNLTVSGTKNRVVETENYSNRLLYAYEMPSPMFGDIGEGVVDDRGECIVEFDDLFAESITLGVEYQVFLQKEGSGDLWVSDKSHTYFMVHGDPGLKFAWEVKAKQRDYEYDRMERYEILSNEEDNGDVEMDIAYIQEDYYEALYDNDIQDISDPYNMYEMED